MLRRIRLFLSLSLLSASAVLAQTSGTIVGHVNDTTGAVVPGVTITLTDTGTNTTRTTVSTSAGDYTFPDVPPGVYNVEATHPGFKVATARNVELQVQQSLTQNFTLQVGEVTQTVSVSATAALLQTDNSSLGTVVPAETLAQTPVNNRNYLNLVAVSANANVVSPTQGQAGARLGGARANESISVGGSRIMFDHYTLDGINNSDPDFNTYVVAALHRRHPGNEGANRRLSRPIRVQRDPGQRGHQERRQSIITAPPSTSSATTTRMRSGITTTIPLLYPKRSPTNITTTDSCSPDRSGFPTSSMARTASSSWSTTNGIPRSVSRIPREPSRPGRPGRQFQPVHHNSKRPRHSHLRSRHRERQWHGQDAVPGQCHSRRAASIPSH